MMLLQSEVVSSIQLRTHRRLRGLFRLPWWSSHSTWKSQRLRYRRFLNEHNKIMSDLTLPQFFTMPIFVDRIVFVKPLQTCKSAEWDSSHYRFRFFWIWPRDFTHTSQHDSWIYVIGTDTVFSQFDCHSPSNLIHCSFWCTICRMIGYGSLESWNRIKCKLRHPIIKLLQNDRLT